MPKLDKKINRLAIAIAKRYGWYGCRGEVNYLAELRRWIKKHLK